METLVTPEQLQNIERARAQEQAERVQKRAHTKVPEPTVKHRANGGTWRVVSGPNPERVVNRNPFHSPKPHTGTGALSAPSTEMRPGFNGQRVGRNPRRDVNPFALTKAQRNAARRVACRAVLHGDVADADLEMVVGRLDAAGELLDAPIVGHPARILSRWLSRQHRDSASLCPAPRKPRAKVTVAVSAPDDGIVTGYKGKRRK